MKKEIKSDHWNVHAIFNCNGCDKSWQDFTTARQKAYAHAKNTGHDVRGEIGVAYQYIPI